jgi:hypothetical protein
LKTQECRAKARLYEGHGTLSLPAPVASTRIP